MTLSTIVPTPTDPTGDVYGWDWSATTHAVREGVLDDLTMAMKPALVLPGKGLQHWANGVELFDGRGDRLGSIYWDQRRDDVHVLSTGGAAETVRSSVVGEMVRTARVDTRVDTLESFESLEFICRDAAALYGSQVTRIESWGGKTPGRTLYVGAPSSAIRVRLYEKWKQSPGQYVDGTNRVEVQLRPPSNAKEKVSGWSREQTFCASRVTTSLADALGQVVVEPGTLHVKKDTPTLEAALQAMSDQYGSTVARWLEHSGGDLSTVLDYMLWKHDHLKD